MKNENIIEFHKDIYRVMEKIIQGEEIQAQYIFNTELIKKYEDNMVSKNDIYFAMPFWVILDEYLNDVSMRIVHAPSVDKGNLLEEYKEYQEEFKKVRGKLN